MTSEVAIAAPAPKALDLALLKAVGLDRAAPEQRELAIHIADRYGLDLMLKHLVLIDGKPYITRDALLHIAHRSGSFDGISTTTPEVVGDEWRCSATVWRRDMTHPFTYGGRYPVKGRNANFAPEMAIKVAESMALRRAFNVAAPVVEERWDVDQAPEPEPKLTLAQRAAAVVAPSRDPETEPPAPEPDPEEIAGEAIEVPPPAGLSASALAGIARQAGKTKGELAIAIGAISGTVPAPTDVSAAVTAMSDEQRGRLADELNLDWRTS